MDRELVEYWRSLARKDYDENKHEIAFTRLGFIDNYVEFMKSYWEGYKRQIERERENGMG